MFYVYDMADACVEMLEPDECVGTIPTPETMRELIKSWPQPRLQIRESALERKVILPPCGLPH